jgi:hypothetical protein
MENINKEGWSIDIGNKRATHYYKDGVSLCKKEHLKFYMDKFSKDPNFSQVLGKVCSICQKKLKKN